jgi:hypothetical protein
VTDTLIFNLARDECKRVRLISIYLTSLLLVKWGVPASSANDKLTDLTSLSLQQDSRQR